MLKHSKSTGTHRSLERGLRLLEAVAAEPQLPLVEAARRTGLPRSTTHHLLQALVRAGYLQQDEATRNYTPAARLHRLSGPNWSLEQLGAMARPALETLTRSTGEGSSIAVWHGAQVRIAAKQESDGPVRVVQDVGAERPLYCTAVGKAIAGWLPPDELAAALARAPMLRRTPKTITSASAFAIELRRIRAAGFAIDDEEQFEGLRCVAMPVFGAGGRVLGSLCVLGPKQRMTYQKLQAARVPLAAQARALSERLGMEPGTADGVPTLAGGSRRTRLG
ncbi:MAG TPA: IclR family transcriptional regulator [Burkholderiaceae bacterium]